MSVPEITPELLRAVADWGNTRGLYAGMARIRSEADNLEREQAKEEERLDEYVQVYIAALVDYNSLPVSAPTPALRAGLRAVLAHRDEEREPNNDQGGWPTYPAVTRDAVYGRPVTRNTYGDPGADPAEECDQTTMLCGQIQPDGARYACTRPNGHQSRWHQAWLDHRCLDSWPVTPRQWDDLRDAPEDVLAVCTTEGDARRDSTAHNGWRWINSTPVSEYSLTAFAPYTEILGGDQ